MNRTNKEMQELVDNDYAHYGAHESIKDVAILLVRIQTAKSSIRIATVIIIALVVLGVLLAQMPSLW